MSNEQLALLSELQAQKLYAMCERDEYRVKCERLSAENDALRQHAQVFLITGAAIQDGTADDEDRKLFAEALAKIAAMGGRRG